ncbi:MAG TPA: bifunctional 3,4-dihydroxy-2-butanone-4-phosphate synthase/GTP cyclohydrolase II [Jiangellaceae bacterium]|nr:bifunctional 3,4-dihydroxy-2-butanone-4-phosphate synthase/GTP cyclohydrolase II [Jiangellaceae bacterium]
MNDIMTDTVPEAVARLATGQPVVVLDNADRENEGDLILPADAATPEVMGMVVRHTSGVVCVGMHGADVDRLDLPPMTPVNTDPKQTAYTTSVDARDGVTTGISAADRAHTAQVLADPRSVARDLSRPGHMFPLRAVPGGVLERPGHTEASVDLMRLAGRAPAGVLAEIVHDDGSLMRAPALREFADQHGLALITIADLIAHLTVSPAASRPSGAAVSVGSTPGTGDRAVLRTEEALLPTKHGRWRMIAYHDPVAEVDHLALVMGEIADGENVAVRLHSECLTGDALGSWRCDCGAQLTAAQHYIAEAGRGVIVYLRAQEGRGIGLRHKVAAYALQDGGRDTVDANLDLGLPVDARDYTAGAMILADLGIRSIELLTHNAHKLHALRRGGIEVTGQRSLPVAVRAENVHYLRTKRDRMGHVLDGLEWHGDHGDHGDYVDRVDRVDRVWQTSGEETLL